MNKNVLQQQERTLTTISIPNTVADMSKHVAFTGVSENYIKSMQLVCESRVVTHRITYTDMVRGEVQDNRARGMKSQIYFEKRGVTAQGMYSG